MAAFAPLKIGGWAYGEILTSAQMNQLNTDFPFALNLRDGGSYTPSGHVIIATPTSQYLMFNGSHFPSAADGGGLNIAGANGLIAALATITVANLATLNVSGNAALGDANTDTLTVNAATTHAAPVTCNDILALNAPTTLSSFIITSGTGRYLERILNVPTDADFSAGPENYDVVTVTPAIFTANRVLTIDGSGLSGYEAIEVEMLDTTHTLTVKHPTTLATLLVMKNASGFANWARFRMIGASTFVVVAKYAVP